MNLAQALEHAHAFALPGFLVDDDSLTEERRKNEEAILLLMDAYKTAPKGQEPFDFDLVMTLADQNRAICDAYGIERLKNAQGHNLARKLSDKDIVSGIACMQKRSVAEVEKSAGPMLADLTVACMEAKVSGTVLGVDIETTSKDPDRGYIINLGLEFMDMSAEAEPHDGHSAYYGLPELYKEKGVPLSEIHQISWDDLAGKTPFRQAKDQQKALLEAFRTFPIMAHNAAFEDSWFSLHLDGYMEAKRAGKIHIIDSRELCRRLDPEVKTLPHESRPAALESWAKRRGTLQVDEKERHLGLDDVDLMFRTVQAEFAERDLF